MFENLIMNLYLKLYSKLNLVVISANLYIHLTKVDVGKKIKALSFYKTQIRANQRDGYRLTSLAKIRGSEIGLGYAEAYHSHRLFL